MGNNPSSSCSSSIGSDIDQSSFSPTLLMHKLTNSPLFQHLTHAWNIHEQYDDGNNDEDEFVLDAQSKKYMELFQSSPSSKYKSKPQQRQGKPNDMLPNAFLDDIQVLILKYLDGKSLLSVRCVNREWRAITYLPSVWLDSHRVTSLPTAAGAHIPMESIQYITSASLKYKLPYKHKLLYAFTDFADFRGISTTLKELQYLHELDMDCNTCSNGGSFAFRSCCLSSCILHSFVKIDKIYGLTSITINSCDRQDVIQLIVQFPNLRRIQLLNHTVHNDTVQQLVDACRSQRIKRLTHLALDCSELLDHSVMQVCQHIQTLHSLSLANMRYITFNSLVCLTHLPALHQLVLSNQCNTQIQDQFTGSFTPEKVLTAVTKLTQLRSLEIEVTSIKRISAQVLQPLAQLKHLIALRLSSTLADCNHYVCQRSKTHLLQLATQLPALQHLSMSDTCKAWPSIKPDSTAPTTRTQPLTLYSGNDFLSTTALHGVLRNICHECSLNRHQEM